MENITIDDQARDRRVSAVAQIAPSIRAFFVSFWQMHHGPVKGTMFLELYAFHIRIHYIIYSVGTMSQETEQNTVVVILKCSVSQQLISVWILKWEYISRYLHQIVAIVNNASVYYAQQLYT